MRTCIAICAIELALLASACLQAEGPGAPTSTPRAPTVAPATTSAATTPTGAPAGYERSCAAEFPWGRQVTRGFVCIEPSFGLTKSPDGALTSVMVRGYAGGSFENNVVVDLIEVDADGSAGARLARKATTYSAPDVGMPGSWSVELSPASVPPPIGRLRLAAFFESPRDGARVAEDILDLK